MSDFVRPHSWQPTRLPPALGFSSKNTGVGGQFLLQCMKVKSESEVSQSCLNPSDHMDCSSPGPSVHGVFQARILEWGAIAFSWFLAIRKDSYLKTRFWWAVHQAVWKWACRSLELRPLLSSTPFPCSIAIFIDHSWLSWLYSLAFPNSVRSLFSSNLGPQLHG